MNSRDHGIALIVVMMTITLLAALVASLTVASLTETAVAANYRDATDAFYAADAAVEFVLQEVARVDDWGELLAASGQSAFVDGPPDGIRPIGRVAIDLTSATVDVTSMATPPAGSVHGSSVLHAFGWFRDLVPSAANRSRTYVAVWLADRSPTSHDEGADPIALSVVGQAFGWTGAHSAVEALIERANSSAVRILGWRQFP